MSDKDEALRLADEIDEKWWRWADNPTKELKAAAELRRQHAEIAALKEALTQARAAPPALRAALAEPKRKRRTVKESLTDDGWKRTREALEWHLERGAWGADLEGVTEAFRAALADPEPEPFVVKHYASDERPIIKGNGFDGLEVGLDRDEAEQFVAWINARITTPPALRAALAEPETCKSCLQVEVAEPKRRNQSEEDLDMVEARQFEQADPPIWQTLAEIGESAPAGTWDAAVELEPVAKVELMTTGGNAGLATRIVEIDDHLRERLRPGQLLYTAPPTSKPLTADHIVALWIGLSDTVLFARAIERAHGIGGNDE